MSVGNTTSGVLFTDASAGAFPLDPLASGETYEISKAALRIRAANSGVYLVASLCDRIWGAGTFNATTVGTTTFSGTPSLAGRVPPGGDYTSFELVAEFVTALTGTVVATASYTNESGVAGRTATLTAVSNSGYTAANGCSQFALQAGDRGIQSVQSLTISSAGTAGTFNIIVARNIAEFADDLCLVNRARVFGEDYLSGSAFGANCCLWLIGSVATLTTSAVSAIISLDLKVVRG